MNLGTRGLAVADFPSLRRGKRSLDSAIFLRDASEQILPTWERGKDRVRPAVKLEPESEELANWLVDLLEPLARGRRDYLTEAVSSFCDLLASRLVRRGEVYLEVVPAEKKADRPAGLTVLPAWIVHRVPRAYLQIVPGPDRPEVGRRWIHIPSGRILRITLPSSLGSPRKHRRLVQRLDRMPDSPPDWAVQSWSIGAKPTHFDYEEFQQVQRLEVERALVRWGSMTYGETEGKTDYLSISRMLLHFRAKAELREAALGALNLLIVRGGSDAQVECTGLPTPADIDAGLEKLWTGEISLSDGLAIAGM